MWHTETVDVSCPYCGEPIEVVVDPSEDAQNYIEDCSVCCRPMVLSVSISSSGTPRVLAARDDD